MSRNGNGTSLATYAPPKAHPGPSTVATGFIGLRRSGGIIFEEYLTELSQSRKINAFSQMRSDGTVNAVLLALSLPVIAASWVVEPAGKDANAKRAADLVQRNLMELLTCCWEQVVRDLLTSLPFGFSVCVKQWQVVKGEALLSDLMPVHPRTILEGGKNWVLGPQGQLLGAWQFGTDGSTYREEYLPGERMVHVAPSQEFRDPEGRSVLRGAYPHFKAKRQLYIIGGIGAERASVGVPIVTYDPQQITPDSTAYEALQNFAEKMLVYENGYVLAPTGTEAKSFKPEVNHELLKDLTTHHDAQIAKSVLASFLQLGTDGKGGAYALSADQTDLFLLCLQSLADYLCAVLNRQVVQELVGYNIATDQYPKLSATVSRASASALADMMVKVTAGQNPAVTMGESDEDWLREQLQLPERTEERGERVEPNAAAPGAEADEAEEDDDKPARPPKEEPKQQNRERIVLPVLQFADPSPFGGEPPAYPALGRIIAQFGAEVRSLGDTLRERVWRITKLPAEEQSRFNVSGQDKFKGLTADQLAALDTAIEAFLDRFFGEEQTEAAFVGTDAEDALLGGYLRLAHAVGVGRAVELSGATAARFAPTRESPEIRSLLQDAFKRLSKNGRVRLKDQLGDIKEILTQGALDGQSAFTVAKDLSGRFEQYSRYEFERLARTEMAMGSQQGLVDEAKAEGFKMLEHLVSGLACPVCVPFKGKRVKLSAAVPGENVAPFHVQCLCSSVLVTEVS